MDALSGRISEIEPGQWLQAVHYDQNRFASGEHLTAAELDRVSSTVPILLRHRNGHAGIANSAALQAAGVDSGTLNPSGGTFVRNADGSPNGVLLEQAMEVVSSAAPKPDIEIAAAAVVAAGEKMASLGITCAADMMTGLRGVAWEFEVYRKAVAAGLKIRTRLYVHWPDLFGPRGEGLPTDPSGQRALLGSRDGTRLAISGVKIFSDGAIASATAAIYGRFQSGQGEPRISPSGREIDGKLMYAPLKLHQMVRTAHDAGFPISIHAIGDYAVDQVMDAYQATGEPQRHRIEHAMILSDAQITRMAKLGCACNAQPEFLKWFGAAYLRQLGPERTATLFRLHSLRDAGVPLSLGSDRPIVGGNPWDGIHTASNRPEGFDPSENVPIRKAFRMYTLAGAEVCGIKDLGAMQPGDLADFQVYAKNPFEEPNPKPEAVFLGGELTYGTLGR